jgi:hypothetical protein
MEPFFVNKFIVNNKDNLQLESVIGNSDIVKSRIELELLQNFHILRKLCAMHTPKFSVLCNVDSQVL